MMGYLSGTVLNTDLNKAIILTASGIGFEVHTPSPLLPGREVSLYLAHVIREQSQDLYGFESAADKKFFETLIDVNGIGPKSAFGLICHLGVKQIITAIVLENVDILKSAPGVGKKSAEQIVLSLKDKVLKLEAGFSTTETPAKTGQKGKPSQSDTHLVRETLAACQGLGFKDQDILPMIQRHMQGGIPLQPEDLVKLILKELR